MSKGKYGNNPATFFLLIDTGEPLSTSNERYQSIVYVIWFYSSGKTINNLRIFISLHLMDAFIKLKSNIYLSQLVPSKEFFTDFLMCTVGYIRLAKFTWARWQLNRHFWWNTNSWWYNFIIQYYWCWPLPIVKSLEEGCYCSTQTGIWVP